MTIDQLLVVQQHDSAIDRLAHQRSTLPELGALADCDDEATHLDDERSAIAERRHALAREQKRLEDDVALIEDRRSSENDRLYSGSVTAHKDLQAIQDELAVLGQRQDQLEEQVLEVMERIEPVDAELDAVDTRIADLAERRGRIEQALAASQAEIDTEIDSERSARADATDGVATELLDEYERVRAASGGIGIARLVSKTCEGCHLQLSAVDYDRIRKEPADALVHCTECGRLLAR